MKSNIEMKKALIIDWDSAIFADIIDAFKVHGYEMEAVKWDNGDYEDNPHFSNKLKDKLKECEYEFVFSFNYFPIVSKVCMEERKKYISWVYDSPHITLYSKTIFNECNYVFHFDSATVEEFRGYGVSNIEYLPLAANSERLSRIWKDSASEKEITFVGSLYEENLYRQINYLPEYLKGYLEGIMKAQQSVYGYNFLTEMLSSGVMTEIKKYVKFTLGEQFFIEDNKLFSEMFLGKEVTYCERKEILEKLSESYQVDLYTYNSNLKIGKVRNRGYINYMEDMPRVFKESKINLNISLKTIQTGIPLRVFDVLGAGGFLITNYQSDLLGVFEPGQDLVVYEDSEDLRNKVEFYLKNPEERKRIARNGYEKVKEYHSYKVRVGTILKNIREKG